MKGTIVGVAPPNFGAASGPVASFAGPAAASGHTGGSDPPSPPMAGHNHSFGSAADANPLAGTMALDAPPNFANMPGAPIMGAPSAGAGAPAFGAPPPHAGGFNPAPYGAAPVPDAGAFNPSPYGAAPSPDAGAFNAPAYGATPLDLNAPGAFGAPGGFGGPPPGSPYASGGAPGGGQYGGPGGPGGPSPMGGAPPQDYVAQMNQGFQQVGQTFGQAADQFGASMNQGMQPYQGGARMGQPGHQVGQFGMNPGMHGAMAVGAGGPPKQYMLTLILSLLGTFGVFGAHRIYSGHIVIGLVQFFTLGGCGVWQLIDIIMIVTGKYTDSQGRPLAKG